MDGPELQDEQATLDRLRGDLARRARDEDLVDVGPLVLAATGSGLLRVAFASEGYDAVLEALAAAVGPRILRDDEVMADYAVAVLAAVERGDTDSDLRLDLERCSGFRREVLEHLRSIPPGETRTYAEVARAVGRPQAVRAVGSACATNPLPLVIPCHRVVRSDGSPGGYLGGVDVKRRLLASERAAA